MKGACVCGVLIYTFKLTIKLKLLGCKMWNSVQHLDFRCTAPPSCVSAVNQLEVLFIFSRVCVFTLCATVWWERTCTYGGTVNHYLNPVQSPKASCSSRIGRQTGAHMVGRVKAVWRRTLKQLLLTWCPFYITLEIAVTKTPTFIQSTMTLDLSRRDWGLHSFLLMWHLNMFPYVTAVNLERTDIYFCEETCN